MSNRVQFRRDTKARWAEVNPILMEGEIGLETDTNNIKMGDGVHTWNELEYGVGIENITSELGDSENLAASQKLVKVELDKKFDKTSVVQEPGDSEELVMSQKAVNAELGKKLSSKTDDSSADFSIGDDKGNVILRLKNGHIKTKNFDSEKNNGMTETSYEGAKLSIKKNSLFSRY